MNHLKVKRKLDCTIIQRKIEKKEQISNTELDIMRKEEIQALLPIQFRYVFCSKWFRVTVKEMMTLADYLKSGISFGAFLDVTEQISNTLRECEAHGIRCSNLELNPELIFFDYAKKTVRMIYWPLLALEEYEDQSASFAQLGGLYNCSKQDAIYRDAYLKFFESRASFDLSRFHRQLEALRKHWLRQEDEASRSQAQEGAAALKKAEEKRRIFEPASFDPEKTLMLMTASLLRVADNSTIPLSHFPFTIGRQADLCDWALEDNAYLGRQHMTLLERNGVIYLRDNGSINGTLLDGSPMQPNREVPLRSGSTIKIGSEEFLFFAAGGQGT